MTSQELYDHYLFDEEYDLLLAPKELYSYFGCVSPCILLTDESDEEEE